MLFYFWKKWIIFSTSILNSLCICKIGLEVYICVHLNYLISTTYYVVINYVIEK
jgi:hypothetical protein